MPQFNYYLSFINKFMKNLEKNINQEPTQKPSSDQAELMQSPQTAQILVCAINTEIADLPS